MVRTDIQRARAALGEARLLRSEYLVSVASGLLEPNDVIDAACTEEGTALRRINLVQLITSVPGVGKARAMRRLSEVSVRLGVAEDMSKKNIGWLIDPRAQGRRFLVWLDTEQPKTTPWPGFPVAPRPKGGMSQ